MQTDRPTFYGLALKTVVVHTVTYFIIGLLAFTLLDYPTKFAEAGLSAYMRSIDDPLVAAGPLFQPVRGILFAIAFYLLRDVFFAKKNGWLIMWIVLVLLGILSTFGPTPGSIEGLIYTTLPVGKQLLLLSEILAQSFLLSVLLFSWVKNPRQRWIGWVLAALFIIVLFLSTMGFLAAAGVIAQ